MPIYSTSRDVGWNACTNSNWSSFMNSYASTPYNPSQTTGLKSVVITGGWNINAPWSGNYTLTVATDDTGTINYGGGSFSSGGFTTSGNSSTKFYSKGQNISWSWTVQNSASSDSFLTNPVAISFALDGPSQPAAPDASISVSPNPIISGQCATLSWSSSGSYLYSVSVTGQSSPSYSGSATVCPSDDATYSITVTGEGGTTTRTATLTVYIPPNVTLSASPSTITAGQCSNLSWTTSGDASSITWLSGGVSNGNLNSFTTVCPSDTTTYSARVSGLGGEDTDSITITVNQIPTATLTVPHDLDYGEQGTIEYTSQYGNSLINLKIYFRNSSGSTLAYDYDLPEATSAQLSAPSSATVRNGTLNTNIVYDDYGPRFVDYVLTVQGSGGSVEINDTTEIIIDETPNNLNLEETSEKYKSQEPVYTPDVVPDEVIESELYLIEDIDIPVEIKANAPIQVDINKSGTWKNIRQM
jgi:hypothetical protein